ncbi:MAG: NADH-quinone oxidoreductase subunit I [Candidatus Micrarchaeaceae archaeon]|nr:NADH-quinone oxidoreductase subunit I [Candidatus Parvarchaeum tengchongense]MCW1295906.1 NADH-quinone oxidoreductase subunit I [Candidatus Parvarchaeum tengchongense]MCW1312086.1 NADH-quinone oxidoreductase subunit I [Candidatus Parvarchaeum tengchongense]
MGIKETFSVFGYGIKESVSKRATYPYPDKPLPIQKRSRGMLSLDLENCIGCELCFKICPSDAIRMQKVDFKEAGFHTNARSEAPAIDFNKCIFCGLCSEICPPKVLHHTHKYDISTDKRKELVYMPFQLRDVYEKLVKPYEEEYDIIKFQKAGQPQSKTESTAAPQSNPSNDNKTNENKVEVKSVKQVDSNTSNPVKQEKNDDKANTVGNKNEKSRIKSSKNGQ